MKNVLITGGAGYIGSVLAPHLLELGYNVTVLDNIRYNQNSLFGICYHPQFKFINGDFRDTDFLVKAYVARPSSGLPSKQFFSSNGLSEGSNIQLVPIAIIFA